MKQNSQDPIAIIGMGCRFPGDAVNPHEFWKNLCDGKDAIIEVPKDRWDSRKYYDSNVNIPGKMYVKEGGFLREKWEEFDAAFFHISPREANFLDPQQRLLLELTWEALEDGGIVPEKIRNTDAGVFIGAFTTDWQSLHNKPFNVNHCSMYSGINGSMTILSARLAYFFDLKGPCLTVDTACSSSLVAVHLACQSIWNKTSTLAIAGGVNAMLIPETTIAMSKGRFLNPEGRCRPFDAKAMGYIRGEGGGVVILKPLADALRDQDPIYALIRGTGVNHDGATQGIAQPSPEAQKSLMQKVLKESGVDPAEIQYIEAHGTGTPVGDPIEAQALNEVLQVSSRKKPCFLGAVKSNIGHLEAAAGVAGLIKTALCLNHEEIPPNLHFNVPNPKIPFEKYCLKVPTKRERFPCVDKPLFAGVNAFGYGGTNAHAILESYKRPASEDKKTASTSVLVPFSAINADSLKDVAKLQGEIS
jgi:acyl transferase domain-containing protein